MGSRLSAAHTRFKHLQQFQGGERYLFNICNNFRDGGRYLFKIRLSLQRRAHSSSKVATVSGMEGGTFSKLGPRPYSSQTFAAVSGMEGGPFQNWALALAQRTFLSKNLQQLQGWRAVPFQNLALVKAPRTFVLEVCNSYRDGGRVVFKIGLSLRRRAHSS